MTLAMNRQALFALFLIVLNTVYFVDSLSLATPFARGEPGPAFVPMLLSLILYVAAGRIFIAELRGRGEVEESEEPLSWKPFLLAALTAGFVAAFEPAGYFIATFGYTFAVAAVFEWDNSSSRKRVLLVAAAVSVGVTVIGHLFFVRLFDLYLPEGLW